jgi:hypothetical protein
MKRYGFLGALITLAGLVFIYFPQALLTDQVFSFRDLSRYYYPLRQFALAQIQSGDFPFWNPYVGSGHPLYAALQSVVLYPLSLVYLIIPDFNLAFNLFLVLHIFLGGLFFYIMMRELDFSVISGLVSAVTFMFGGYLISVINLSTTLSSVIWFPLVFVFFRRAILQGRLINTALASVFLGFMFLGGEPTPMYAAVFLLGLYSIFHIVDEPKTFFPVTRALLLLLLIFAFLFSFQIIPFAELIKLSNRSATQFKDAVCWSFPPQDIMNLVMPFFRGPLNYLDEGPMRQDWLLLSYLGIIPVILFVISFIFRRDKLNNFFKLTFLLGLFLVLGRFTPFYKFLYDHLIGFSMIRYPVKFFFVSAFAFSFLAGSGWEEFTRRAGDADTKILDFVKGLFIFSFCAAILFLFIYLYKGIIADLARNSLDGQPLLTFTVNLFNFRRLLVFFILGTLIMFVASRKKIGFFVAGLAMVSLIYADLYGQSNIDVNPMVSKDVLKAETPNIRFLKNDASIYRIYVSEQMNRINELLKGDTYEHAFMGSLDHLCANRLIQFGISDARGYFSIHNSNYSKVLNLADTAPKPSTTNVLNMLNIKYVLTPKEIEDHRMKLVNKGYDSFLYENLDVLPRAYLVSEFMVIKGEEEIANKLKSKDFNPARQVILEEEPSKSQKSKVKSKNPVREDVKIIEYHPDRVIIEAKVKGKPKFLVLADNYYPGWEVSVDGSRERLYKANYTLRAVYLEPGTHSVVFKYNPVSFKLGALISLFTLVILVYACFLKI